MIGRREPPDRTQRWHIRKRERGETPNRSAEKCESPARFRSSALSVTFRDCGKAIETPAGVGTQPGAEYDPT
jgi:hypothetical protein